MPTGVNSIYTQGIFRVRKDQWENFKNKSGNASRLLNLFIRHYLAGAIETKDWLCFDSSMEESINQYIEDQVDRKLKLAIADLEARLTKQT